MSDLLLLDDRELDSKEGRASEELLTLLERCLWCCCISTRLLKEVLLWLLCCLRFLWLRKLRRNRDW